MAWSIVNVHLPDADAVRGENRESRDLILQIVSDGYEPFSTAAMGEGIVMSFRKMEATEPPTFGTAELPGQYL